MQFPYAILPAEEEDVKKPWIKVRLGCEKTHKLTSTKVYALLDTGADVCFCATPIVEWLGADYTSKKPKKFTAANGSKFIGRKVMLDLYIGRDKIKCPFYTLDNYVQKCPLILGQKGFMYDYSVEFNAPEDVIIIE